jgi:hypothetical protein
MPLTDFPAKKLPIADLGIGNCGTLMVKRPAFAGNLPVNLSEAIRPTFKSVATMSLLSA